MSATALLTFAEFEQLPDAPGKRELICGEVIEMAPPRKNHTLTAERFSKCLRAAVGEDRIHLEAGYKIGDSWVQPDVSVAWPEQKEDDGYFAGAPMLAIEVLSEHTSAQQLEDKLDLYLSNGAKEVWTVSRKTSSMTVYSRAEAGRKTMLRVTGEYTPEWLGVSI